MPLPCSSVFIRSKRPSCIIHHCCSAPSLIKPPLPHRCSSPTALTKRTAIASNLVVDPETISASLLFMLLRKTETGRGPSLAWRRSADSSAPLRIHWSSHHAQDPLSKVNSGF
ncbi:hypothetical protein CGRA01v4_08711 [Colletotrichum graminicola]|nr:hypothetical protein CGRA01v4_08711 [Colletotrichum graminicola]